MHTPTTEEVFVEPPKEANLQRTRFGDCEEHSVACDARRQPSKHKWVSLLEDVGFRRSMAASSVYNREDDGVKM